MSKPVTQALVLLLGLLVLQAHSAAARDKPAEAPPATASADPDAWRFRFAAYGWAMNVAGSLTARGQTSDVNASFIQIIQKSDSLLGYMGYFEADKGRMGFYTDMVWAKLGFDRSTAAYRNPVAGLQLSASANAAVKYSITIIEMGGLYEIAH